MRPETRCVHAGWTPLEEEPTGAVNPPIYATSTYAYRRFGEHTGWEYSRTANPTRSALERAVAELEGGADAAAFASGLAAIDAVTSLLDTGDEIVCSADVYGGTYRLLATVTSRRGIVTRFVDARDPGRLAAALTPRTRLVLVETPTNPLMHLVDLDAAARAAHAAGAWLAVDNTFMTPLGQRPLEHGADLVIHSTTKYLNGHSDAVGGVAVAREAELGERLHTIQNAVGAVMGPFDAYLVLRGIRTLAVRWAAHQRAAAAVAERLARRLGPERVLHPGLPSHPQHELARRQQRGFGAMISVDLGDAERAARFCEALEVFTLAESLGGVESLVCHPATMTHAAVPPEDRRRRGIGDGLVRLSVGIEAPEDLLEDLERGLAAAGLGDARR